MRWHQGELLEVMITDLSDRGDGVGRCAQRVVFVPDTVTGDRALVRLTHVKPQYAYGRLEKLLEPSPHRVRPFCIVADKCGGCQWQHVAYPHQQQAKRQQVIQALQRIGHFANVSVDPMVSIESPCGYRNKATYPLGRSTTGQVQAGYYRKRSHQVVNLNQCPVQDSRLNPLLAELKQDLHDRGWAIYQEETHQGLLRHLSLRIGRRTGEILITLVTTDWALPGIEAQAQVWQDRYPQVVGVCLNRNRTRTNAIFGVETRCITGRSYLQEIFAGLTLQINPAAFFQIYTEQAEALVEVIRAELKLQGMECVIDAYCGVGTLTLPLAKHCAKAIGIEIHPQAIELARTNAAINGMTNVEFTVGKVEEILPEVWAGLNVSEFPTVPAPESASTILVLDPPRKGCDRQVLETVVQFKVDRVVYVSCKPATLARDLKILCDSGVYRLDRVQPADFFPQTTHVECVAFLSGVWSKP